MNQPLRPCTSFDHPQFRQLLKFLDHHHPSAWQCPSHPIYFTNYYSCPPQNKFGQTKRTLFTHFIYDGSGTFSFRFAHSKNGFTYDWFMTMMKKALPLFLINKIQKNLFSISDLVSILECQALNGYICNCHYLHIDILQWDYTQ